MIGIKIINATPGPDTTEQILTIIQAQNTGITIKEISKSINRPVSMIQICLKKLISSKDIFVRKNKTGSGLIYYPRKVSKI
ncbi:MAG: winged helix-turn-helix transcriptional regulator [Pleurocapsa sp.]